MEESFQEWRARLADGDLSFEERRFYEFAISAFLQDWERGARMTATPSRGQARRFLEKHYTEAIVAESDLDIWRAALEWVFDQGGITPAPDHLADPEAAELEPPPAEQEKDASWFDELAEEPADEDENYDLPPLLHGGFDRAAEEQDLGEQTAKSYWNWLRRFGGFCQRDGRELDDPDAVAPFLQYLRKKKKLSAHSCNQALIALKFVFRHVFQPAVELKIEPARKRDRIPVTLSRIELDRLFAVMDPELRLMCRLMYGAGLRTPELIELRVRDLDFDQQLLKAPGNGKDDLERDAPLPHVLLADLKEHLQRIHAIYENERDYMPGVDVPEVAASSNPDAARSWDWYWVFPSRNLTRDKSTGAKRRHHWNSFTFQRSVKKAAKLAGLEDKRVTPQIFRHSFALHLLQSGTPPKTVQKTMGHRTMETTMSYVHAMRRLEQLEGPVSPLDH